MISNRFGWMATGLVMASLSGLLIAQEASPAKEKATEKKADSKSADDPVPPPPPPPRAVKKPSATKEAAPKTPSTTAVVPNAAMAQLALVKIQIALGQNPEWDGIQISSVRFESDQDQVLLVVEGRLSEGRFRSKAQKVCESVLQDIFLSENGALPLPKLDQMKVIRPAPREAATIFDEGLQHYRKGNYESASQEVTRAIVENPFNLGYKYWLVVVEVAAGHDDQARRLLRPLILRRSLAKSNKQTDEFTEVQRRLESVQGAIRQKMNRLEEELLSEMAAKKE
jgi:hypothetical protein